MKKITQEVFVSRIQHLSQETTPDESMAAGTQYYHYRNENLNRIYDSLEMDFPIWDAVHRHGQTMPIPEFPYIQRYRIGAYWIPQRTWYDERITANYFGGFLLSRENYPRPNQYSYILVLPPIYNLIDRIVAGNYQETDFRNLLRIWLFGANETFGKSYNRTHVYGQELADYRSNFQLFLNYDPFLKLGTRQRLQPKTTEYLQRLQQWENLLNYDGSTLTATQLELLPDPNDKARWLVFADSLEEVCDTNPYLFFLRFFNTEPQTTVFPEPEPETKESLVFSSSENARPVSVLAPSDSDGRG